MACPMIFPPRARAQWVVARPAGVGLFMGDNGFLWGEHSLADKRAM